MKFTPRELEILRCRCELGLSRRETAARLYVEDTTIKKDITRMLARFGIKQQSALACLCYRYGRSRAMQDAGLV
jgi:DNA-binding NarL/FixJ family response regulator